MHSATTPSTEPPSWKHHQPRHQHHGTRTPGMRFPDPRAQALLGACCALAPGPPASPAATCGTTSPPRSGKTPEDMTGGQISYDLRKLRDCQIIERIPHSQLGHVSAGSLEPGRTRR